MTVQFRNLQRHKIVQTRLSNQGSCGAYLYTAQPSKRSPCLYGKQTLHTIVHRLYGSSYGKLSTTKSAGVPSPCIHLKRVCVFVRVVTSGRRSVAPAHHMERLSQYRDRWRLSFEIRAALGHEGASGVDALLSGRGRMLTSAYEVRNE